MLIDVSREPTVLNLKVQRQREKASAEIVNSAEPLLDAIAEACRRRFSERRRLFDGDLESISQVMLREFDTAVSSIVSFDHKREPTRVRPKGDAIEHFRMFVGPGQKSGQDKAAIWSLHLYATSKHAMIEFRRFPSTWKAHVSARMHERIEADLDAEREVAQTIILDHFMISAATDAIQEDNLPARLAIPCREGLLLGQIEMLHPSEGGSFRCNFTRIGAQQIPIANRYLFPAGPHPERVPTWTAQTFIGPNEVRPRQEEYAARFSEIRNRFKDAADLIVQHQTLGTSLIKPFSEEMRSEAAILELREAHREAKQALKVLLAIPRFSIACGNEWDGYELEDDPDPSEEFGTPLPAL